VVTPLDVPVATTLANAARAFKMSAPGATNGLQFERTLYEATLNAHEWRYATPPDQYDLGLPICTRTGTRYEHDGMFVDKDALYVIEAKWLRGPITREIVGIFVQKLLDTLLGSYAEIGHFALKPLIVSGNADVDASAWRYAAAFGILLIVPHEVIGILQREHARTAVAQRLADECAVLAAHLWRPFNTILHGPDHKSETFPLAADQIYDANRTTQLLAQWDECIQTVADLRLLSTTRSLRP